MVLADVRDIEGGIQRDFCGKHATQTVRNFKWSHHPAEEKSKPKRKLGPSKLRGRTRFTWNLTDVEQFVKEHDKFTASDLAKHLNLHKGWVNVNVVPELIKMGIVRIEGKGRARKLVK